MRTSDEKEIIETRIVALQFAERVIPVGITRSAEALIEAAKKIETYLITETKVKT